MINTTRTISLQEALQVGNALGINWNQIDISQFRRGLEVELEHGLVYMNSNVTDNNMLMTGKIALAHLNELSDYYTRLDVVENAKFNANQNNLANTNINNTSLLAGAAVGAGLFLFINYLSKKK